MRGHLSLALLVFSALLLHSEVAAPASDFARHNEGVGIKLGLTASGIRGEAAPSTIPTELVIGVGRIEPRLGLTVGLLWSYAFASRFSIQSEFSIVEGGVNGGMYSGQTRVPDSSERLTYLEFALLPKVHFGERDRHRFSIYAGPTVDYEVADKVEPSGITQTADFQYGLGAGVMWDYDNGKVTTLVDLRYTTSFSELQPDVPESSVKNQAVALSLGLAPGSRRARGQRAIEHSSPDSKLSQLSDQRIRVELHDGSRKEGRFVRYQPGELTISMDGREEGIAMGGVRRVSAHRGQAKKGAVIGGLTGLGLGIVLGTSDEFTDEGLGGAAAVVCVVDGIVLGAIIGGIDHWVDVYP